MKIKEIINQRRRDFTAIYICEYCGHEVQKGGYDDRNYHENVIPEMKCVKCGRKAPENHRPLKTKYDEWEVV